MKIQNALIGSLILAVVGEGSYLAYRRLVVSAGQCDICGRTIHAGLEATILSKTGKAVRRFGDIERFSRPDRFRFQIVSYVPKAGGPTEAYNFQLMEDLPEGAYDYLWVRLHLSSYYPAVAP